MPILDTAATIGAWPTVPAPSIGVGSEHGRLVRTRDGTNAGALEHDTKEHIHEKVCHLVSALAFVAMMAPGAAERKGFARSSHTDARSRS
jgi:hypothetical protein